MLTARRRDGHAGTKRARGDWTSIPIHPFLVAAYPIVFLFAANADEQVTLDPLWTPLALALGATAVILVALALLLRDWLRAALLTTVALIGFFGYGHAWNAASTVLTSQWPLIIAWGLLVVIGFVAAWRAGPIKVPVTRALNLVAALALILNGGGMAGDDGRARLGQCDHAGSARSSWRRRIRTTFLTSTTSSSTDTPGRPRSGRRTDSTTSRSSPRSRSAGSTCRGTPTRTTSRRRSPWLTR